MNRLERRRRRTKKIKQRSNLMKALNMWLDKDEFYYGNCESDNVIDMSNIDLKEISDAKRYYSLLHELSTITRRSILVATQK